RPDVTYEWSNAAGLADHLRTLERLCQNVIRIGHSSSLVMAWLNAEQTGLPEKYWQPSDKDSLLTCRIATSGELERLKIACRAEEIELFANLKEQIESTKGKEQKAVKERFAEAFGEPYKNSSRPPEPTPPVLGIWQGYRRSNE